MPEPKGRPPQDRPGNLLVLQRTGDGGAAVYCRRCKTTTFAEDDTLGGLAAAMSGHQCTAQP